jgi:hypothetical protein
MGATTGCGGAGASPDVYGSDYLLRPEKENTVFPGSFRVLTPTDLSGGPAAPLPTLLPGGLTKIALSFKPQAALGNFIYTITPEIVLNDGNTEMRVNLQQLSMVLAFADPDQFTCYNLRGDTFVPTQFTIDKDPVPSSRSCV